MTDFLLELRSEEIPARMQVGARASLEKLLREQLAAAGVTVAEITVYSTPRRLALIARGLPDATAAVSEEVKGPRVGAPPQALEGFLRKTGLTAEQLTERDGVLFAITEKPGRATRDVLAEAIPAICRAFPWPKSMRWGAASISTESLRWVRPLSGIVAIFGEDLVPCEVGGVTSGYATLGHRFHHPGVITIGGADDYAEKLRACHVLVNHAEREGVVREMSRAAALNAGLTLVEDEGLVIENAGLTEWPVPLLGRFDAEFLEVPPEVIQLTARTNQKYFICTTPLPLAGGAGGGPVQAPAAQVRGNLANAFVCTANIEAVDGGAGIIDGNRKVLAARLSDARFFWQQDRKTSLEDQAKKLARITFHEKLGSLADKADRVAKLARWLVEQGIVGGSNPCLSATAAPPVTPTSSATPAKAGVSGSSALAPEMPAFAGMTVEVLADQAELAARLCKADLVTEMVGEFPELQGLMGGYYARAEGLPDAVADAIRDHYKPVGQGDDVPTAPVTVAVALADKLDTIYGFFYINERPTGSKDPFALRRAALGILAILLENQIRAGLAKIIFESGYIYFEQMTEDGPEFLRYKERYQHLGDDVAFDIYIREGLAKDENFVGDAVEFPDVAILTFFADRLKVQQKEAGVRHDLIDAVFALGGEDDLVRLLARVHALQAFVATPDGANLLAGYKRAANILKKENWSGEVEIRIPRDGEEDPFAMVDDPDVGAAMVARLEQQKALSYTPEPAEKALMDALDFAGPQATAAVAAEDFAGAMAALASLRAPIDAFFEGVMVNDPDATKRLARLSLLDRFRAAVHNVADFSRIEG